MKRTLTSLALLVLAMATPGAATTAPDLPTEEVVEYDLEQLAENLPPPPVLPQVIDPCWLVVASWTMPCGGSPPVGPEDLFLDCPGYAVAEGSGGESTWRLLLVPRSLDTDSDEPPLIVWAFYAQWQLQASTLNNGADGYAFGAIVHSNGQELKDARHGKTQQKGCMELGVIVGAAPTSFEYLIEGGAYGTSGSETCSQTVSISATAGVEFSVTGPSGSASVTIGASWECGTETVFDSEVMVGTTTL